MKKFSVFLFSVLLFFLLTGVVSALTIGNDIIDRGSLDGATNIAFIDPTLVFPTAGSLDSWDFWLTGDLGDQFAAQIYRYTGTASLYELVYSNTIQLSGSFDNAYLGVSSSQPFNIEAGDFVGWWFGSAAGVIPYDYTGTSTDQVEWSYYTADPILSPTVGNIYSFGNTGNTGDITYREYSIAANYSPTAPVPEPTTMLLLGTGLVGLAGFGRKKFRKKIV